MDVGYASVGAAGAVVARRRLLVAAWLGWSVPFVMGVGMFAMSLLMAWSEGRVEWMLMLFSLGMIGGSLGHLAMLQGEARRVMEQPYTPSAWVAAGGAVYSVLLLLGSGLYAVGSVFALLLMSSHGGPDVMAIVVLIGLPVLGGLYAVSVFVFGLRAVIACGRVRRLAQAV